MMSRACAAVEGESSISRPWFATVDFVGSLASRRKSGWVADLFGSLMRRVQVAGELESEVAIEVGVGVDVAVGVEAKNFPAVGAVEDAVVVVVLMATEAADVNGEGRGECDALGSAWELGLGMPHTSESEDAGKS